MCGHLLGIDNSYGCDLNLRDLGHTRWCEGYLRLRSDEFNRIEQVQVANDAGLYTFTGSDRRKASAWASTLPGGPGGW